MFFFQSKAHTVKSDILTLTLSGTVCKPIATTHCLQIARRGDIRLSRQELKDIGLGRGIKKMFTGEGPVLMKCSGVGRLYCADAEKKICIIELHEESICLNGNDILAMSGSLRYSVEMMRGVSLFAAGLFNVRVRWNFLWTFRCMACAGIHNESFLMRAGFPRRNIVLTRVVQCFAGHYVLRFLHSLALVKVRGSGMIALTCHGCVISLMASKEDPVYTDPRATVAWSHAPKLQVCPT